MAGETKLGTAVVPIRATMDELDKDLATAKAKCETASTGLSKALGGVKWAAVGAAATTVTGALSDLARAGAEDEASMVAVSVAVENAAGQLDQVSAALAQNKASLDVVNGALADTHAQWGTLREQLTAAETALAATTGADAASVARKKELQATVAALRAKLSDLEDQEAALVKQQDGLTAAVAKGSAQVAAMGKPIDESNAELSAFIDHLRDTAGIADDQSKSALSGLIAVTGDYQKSMELASLAADLARGKHMSYESAAQLVGRVAEGNTAILKRYGITLDENATAEEALAELQRRFAGQGAAYAATAQGQMEIMSLRINDLKENVGQTMGPAMAFVGMLPGLSAGFSMVGGAVGTVTPLLGPLAASLTGSVIPAIGATVVALGPVLLIVAAVVAVVAGLYLAYQSNFLGIRDITDSVVGWLKDTIGQGIAWISDFWSEHWDEISQVLSTVWDMMTLNIRVAWTLLSGILTAGLQILNGDWGGAWQTIQNTLASIWETMKGTVRSGVNTIIGFINRLIGAWNALSFTIPGFSVEIPHVDVPGVGRVGGGNLGWEGVNVGTPDLPMIPTLDAGAVVTQPTLAALAMNARPEAVIPLSQLGGGLGRTYNAPLIGQVIVQNEADEDRLVRKLWAMLNDDRDALIAGGVA